MTNRRHFLAKLGVLASAAALDANELQAAPAPDDNREWDTSWIAALASAEFKAVFNASDISDGAVLNYVGSFLDQFRELHNTTDAQTRAVAMFRRLGTPMAFNDHLWDRYEIGADRSIKDPATGAPARRNIFWRSDSISIEASASKLQGLMDRGLISLVCNVSVGVWSSGMAEKTNRPAEEIRNEVITNLVPGAIPVPSGIYAMIRAQNAGAAYMPGT